jgi:hypothetical protein
VLSVRQATNGSKITVNWHQWLISQQDAICHSRQLLFGGYLFEAALPKPSGIVDLASPSLLASNR